MIAGFYTYIHIRADDGRVFYVGKGKGARWLSEKGGNQHWQRTALKHGWRAELVAHWFTEGDAFDHEKQLIALYRGLGDPLCNKTDGGDGAAGVIPTAETRAKLSRAGKGSIVSAETRAKISAGNKGRKHSPEQIRKNSEARLGKSLKPEAVAKISAALTGRPRSAEVRAKISAAHKGKIVSAEHLAKLHASTRGRVRSAEFRAKVSSGLTGRPVSQETRAKISAAHAGRTIDRGRRDKISKTLTGRVPTLAERERFLAWVNDPERRARHSAAMKGRPWSDARRAAYLKAASAHATTGGDR